MPNNDEIKGKFDQVRSKVKQEVGKATGDQALRDEGLDDEASGIPPLADKGTRL